jgi:methionyl-tRNA formyltransferase
MKKVNIVLICGLTNGKIIYDYFSKNKHVNLCLVITYPDSTTRPRHVQFPNNTKIIKVNEANSQIETIIEQSPEYIFVAGWSELLSKELINIPSSGTIGFHPSKLPHDKGRSVLAWQIEGGYRETALTMFYYNDFPDGGDILAQEKIQIHNCDYVNDILNKVDEATFSLIRAYFPLIRQNKIVPIKQDIGHGNIRRLRNKKDDIINWNKTSSEIYNKIRAISRPYPGATFEVSEDEKIKVWKAEVLHSFPWGKECQPGTIVAKLFNRNFVVKTKDSFIILQEWEKVTAKS